MLVSAEAAGDIEPYERDLLEASPDRWAATLHQLLVETEESLVRMARSNLHERDQVVADLAEERDRLAEALARLSGEDIEAIAPELDVDELAPEPEPKRSQSQRKRGGPDKRATNNEQSRQSAKSSKPMLQASWDDDRIVVWAGAPGAPAAALDELQALIDRTGAAAIDWAPYPEIPVPSGRDAQLAEALAAPVAAALGWLVGVAAGPNDDTSPSARWIGEVAAWATELVAQGRMVPRLVPEAPTRRSRRGDTTNYAVRWVPAIVDGRRLRSLAARMPGAVAVLDRSVAAERLCRSVLEASVHAICSAGAARLVSPATVPVSRSHRDLAEAVLAGLDGSSFAAARGPGGQLAHRMALWGAPVTGTHRVGLMVELHPPEPNGGWLLTLTATGIDTQPLPLEKALADASRNKAKDLHDELRRLQRALPVLGRSSKTRSEVVLDTDEAWELMTDTGAALLAAGFGVRVPATSKRRPKPKLQLRADPVGDGESKVGVHQLSQVQWSVLFDDVELDAVAIHQLATESRPVVQAKGRWVELDRSDLETASRVLAEQSQTTELSGAAIIRFAVGLEENPLGGDTVAVAGKGWAVDLVREATATPPAPLPAPKGFEGELRSYQAEARGWLAFLDRAGLGGCLALDMGLGKTPTVLAHLLQTRNDAPALVIAPAAVLGNWAVEAERFTPDLRVRVHHGSARASAEELAAEIEGGDLVLTTYATAVRDVEALEAVHWDRVILDEAQAIKNPASETAQQLRRVPARSRLALTGTPVENSLGDLWSILDYTNPGLVGTRSAFVKQLSGSENGNGGNGNGGNGNGSNNAGAADAALRALNNLLVFRRTKAEPAIAAELPDKIDELDHCGMTNEQIGLYQAILDNLMRSDIAGADSNARKGHVLAAITALKQVCDHPAAYLHDDEGPLAGRSGKLARLDELIDSVFEAGERMLVFTHFARWGERLAQYLSERTGVPIACYHGGQSRGVRDRLVREFQEGTGPGALVLSIKAGGAGLNLTAANHVVLYDRWWNPAVEDQARDRAWRIGQHNTVLSHRLVCPGTIDERVEEIVAGKRRIADLVLPASSSLGDLDAEQLQSVLGLRPEDVIATDESSESSEGARQ